MGLAGPSLGCLPSDINYAYIICSETSSTCSAVTNRLHHLHSNIGMSGRFFRHGSVCANRIKPLQPGHMASRSVITGAIATALIVRFGVIFMSFATYPELLSQCLIGHFHIEELF
jgi:hypothetical protein